MLRPLRRLLAAVFDRLSTPQVGAGIEKAVVIGAAGGFLVHLGAIGLARLLPNLPQTLFQGLDKSPLQAVYTPFSVILFYEVVLLVFAPGSV